LIAEKIRADYFEAMVAEGANPDAAANWLLNEYMGRLNQQGEKSGSAASPMPTSAGKSGPETVRWGPLLPSSNSSIVVMTTSGEINTPTAKKVLEYLMDHPERDPREYVVTFQLRQVTDVSAIETLVDDIIAKNPDKVGDAKSNPKAIGWFVGQVMKASGGKANPQVVNELLKKRLGT
jgi:aspartyl-tRNA(Asn)/glutamyl-tRNA(Gln) amidotransferase subunit B